MPQKDINKRKLYNQNYYKSLKSLKSGGDISSSSTDDEFLKKLITDDEKIEINLQECEGELFLNDNPLLMSNDFYELLQLNNNEIQNVINNLGRNLIFYIDKNDPQYDLMKYLCIKNYIKNKK